MVESSEHARHVFISYSRDDKVRANELRQALEAAGVPVWFDKSELWPGEDWRAKIRQAISDNALLFVACFSRASTSRARGYQNEEVTVAIEQLRVRSPLKPWLIPIRFDDCEIPDLEIGAGRTLRSIQRADLFGQTFKNDLDRLICAALKMVGPVTVPPRNAGDPDGEQDLAKRFQSWPGIPKIRADLDRIVCEKPPYWEYLLFAGTLGLELDQLEGRYEDYALGYAPRLGIVINDKEFAEFLRLQFTELLVIGESFMRIFNTETAERAFGRPGVPGDVSRLQHLAKRYISVYEELLRWAERLRGTSIPAKYRNLIDVMLKYPEQPIEELRNFVKTYAESIAEFPVLAQKGEPIRIEHKVSWRVPDELSEAFRREKDRISKT
jgi:hypothetical protein